MRKNILKTLFSVVFLFIIISGSIASPRNVLVEYITGTWCGNCPCGHQTLNTITSANPNTIVLAYHAFGTDPFRNFNGNEIVNLLGLVSTPTSVIDRNIFVGTLNYPQWISGVQNRYSSSPESPVDIVIASKSFNDVTNELTLNVNATALEDLSGQFKINVVIYEDNLIYQQNFYQQCGTPGIVPNYEHDHVTRNMVNGAAGENLNMGNNWSMNQTISKDFQTTIDASWIPDNCRIVLFVYKEGSTLRTSEVMQAVQESVTGTTGIISNNTGQPGDYMLSQNYPNPFNPTTNIKFSIPKDGNVSFKIIDISGKEVENYVNGFLQRGSYNVEFDGSSFASGIYFYELKTDNFTDRKKMILLK